MTPDEKVKPEGCPECGSLKEPRAELKVLGANDEHLIYRCPDCGYGED